MGTIAGAQTISIQLASGAFKVTGWQAPATPPAGGWASVLNVYAGPATAPMLGRHAVEGGVLVFRPTYPLAPGVKYRVVFHQPGQRQSVERIVDGPAQRAAAPTRVAQIYPS